MMLTSGRVTALAIGLPLVLATAALGGLTMVVLYAHTGEHHVASYAWHGGDISVQSGSGSVRVVAGAGNDIEVAYTEHYSLKRPTLTATELNGGLQLKADCSGFFGNNCYTNYVLTVPASANLVLHSGDGSLHVIGVSGTEKLTTGDGSIQLDNVSGALAVDCGDGSVHGTQIRSTEVTASAGDGSLDFEWVVPPARVAASTGDGSISLVVPSGSGPYQVTTHTGNGGVAVSVPTDTSSSSSISAHTGDGSIHIGTN